MNKLPILLFTALTLLLCLSSCHDDSDEPGNADSPWTVFWSNGEDEAVIDIYGRYYSLYSTFSGEPDSTLTLSCDADWLQLQHTDLPADGIIQLLAQANNDGAGRTATIVVHSELHPDSDITLLVHQRGLSEGRANADENPDPMSDYRVGWGFNVFEEYKSLNSLRGRIIDGNKLEKFDSDTTFNSMQEAVRGLETFQVFSAWSLQEMSMKLTKEMTTQTNFVAVKKTTKRFTEINKKSSKESACSYARLQKTVASRSMDEGALRYIIGEKDEKDLPFTNSFREAYNKVVNSSGAERDDAIRDLIDNYGTHLIISASVGCKMDLCLTFEKSTSYEFQKETVETSKKVFGRTKKSKTEKVSEHLSCDISNSNCIQVSGGSEETRSRLETTIRTLTDINVLEGNMVEEWMNSVTPGDLYDAQRRKDLDVVDFRFMPVWELFSDTQAKAAVLNYVIDMSHRSDCDFTDRELGIDNYQIDLNDKSLANFSTEQNASLVRMARLSSSKTPIMEICQEYVPKIRSDRRIVVYYPILEGRTRIGQGIFRGDGDMPPCTLAFSDGDLYVDPIEGYGSGDILDTLYYVHGNLYAQDFGIGMQKQELTATNEVFRVDNITIPIVKIGSGYWTRRNMNESLGFGTPKDPNNLDGAYTTQERFRGNMLFTNIFYGNSAAFRESHPKLFDNEKDEQTGAAIHWYLPMPRDISELKEYIGQNPKALFVGQPSGFDAQFSGLWGQWDIMNGNAKLSQNYYYEGDYCFIAAKQSQYSGSVMALGKDYSMRLIDIDSDKADWFPVRAFRTSYYTCK